MLRLLRYKESAGINNLQILYSNLNSMMHSISFCTVINASYFNTIKITTSKML